MFSAVKAGFSCGPPLSEDVWSLSLSESVGAAGCCWVVFGCVGVSEAAGGGSVPSSLGLLCDDVATALYSAAACSLGTWQQEGQTLMAVDKQPDLQPLVCKGHIRTQEHFTTVFHLQ